VGLAGGCESGGVRGQMGVLLQNQLCGGYGLGPSWGLSTEAEDGGWWGRGGGVQAKGRSGFCCGGGCHKGWGGFHEGERGWNPEGGGGGSLLEGAFEGKKSQRASREGGHEGTTGSGGVNQLSSFMGAGREIGVGEGVKKKVTKIKVIERCKVKGGQGLKESIYCLQRSWHRGIRLLCKSTLDRGKRCCKKRVRGRVQVEKKNNKDLTL